MTSAAVVGSWHVAVASACELAERPVWDARSETIVWVDVIGGVLHRSTPAGTEGATAGAWYDETVSVGDVLGAVALRTDGGLVAAVDSSFRLLDADGRDDGDPVVVDLPAGQRFNDAACDPAGRLLAGTTSTVGQVGAGLLWLLAPSGQVRVLLEAVTESNGLDWSSDGTILYFVDSGEPVVRRYAYDVGTGELRGRLADLAVLGPDEGVPDGLVVDSEGAVWVALWEGGAVRRYAPDGDLIEHHVMPVDRPTCPAFAGAGLDVLVVTTGWEGLDQSERALQPWAGHLLTGRVDARGRLPHRFGGGPR